MNQRRLASHIDNLATQIVTAKIIALKTNNSAITWSNSDKTFTAFASDLNWSPGDTIILTNPKTEGSASFTNPVPKRDRENDITWWDLTSNTSAKLRIFND